MSILVYKFLALGMIFSSNSCIFELQISCIPRKRKTIENMDSVCITYVEGKYAEVVD